MDAVRTYIATLNDIDEMHEFLLNDFLLGASLSVAINLTREQADQGFRDIIELRAPSWVSTGQKNSKNRIVGINLAAIVEHEEVEYKSGQSRTIQSILDLMRALNENKWSLIPADVTKLLYIDILSVDQRYRGRGLAQELLAMSYQKARNAGATGAYAEGGSLASHGVEKVKGEEKTFEFPPLRISAPSEASDLKLRFLAIIEHCVPSGVTSVQRNDENIIVGINLSSIVIHGEDEDDSESPTNVHSIGDLLRVLNKNKLLALTYEKAQEVGTTAVFAESTSLASQKMFIKIGYEVLREIRLDEFMGKDQYSCARMEQTQPS